MGAKAKLYVVATPIGNIADLSQRAKQVLQEVNWIAAEDTRHSGGLLQHLGIGTALISYHEHNEQQRTHHLIQKLLQGEQGALISDAGTPVISDPGYNLIRAAHEAHIPVVPVPGPCAAITALSASGLATDKFFFEGFLPAKAGARQKRLASLAQFEHTLIFYEAPHRILALLEDCAQIFNLDRKICIARELTKKFEAIHLSPLGQALADVRQGVIPAKGEFVILIEGYRESAETLASKEQAAKQLLITLLKHVTSKQAVQITKELTGLSKNHLYDWVLELQQKNS